MDNIQREIDLRLEEISGKIEELRAFANANGRNFELPISGPDFYCDEYIKNDDYLSEYNSHDGQGAWLSSSDFC